MTSDIIGARFPVGGRRGGEDFLDATLIVDDRVD
jgi:hypothetical protein